MARSKSEYSATNRRHEERLDLIRNIEANGLLVEPILLFNDEGTIKFKRDRRQTKLETL